MIDWNTIMDIDWKLFFNLLMWRDGENQISKAKHFKNLCYRFKNIISNYISRNKNIIVAYNCS